MGITWGWEGTLQLRDSQDISVQTPEEVNEFQAVLTAKTTIPPRNLVVASVTTNLPSSDSKAHFDFIPLQNNTLIGPNCVIYPLDLHHHKGGVPENTRDFDKSMGKGG